MTVAFGYGVLVFINNCYIFDFGDFVNLELSAPNLLLIALGLSPKRKQLAFAAVIHLEVLANGVVFVLGNVMRLGFGIDKAVMVV